MRRRYLAGLLDRVERKNGWQLAEHLGEAPPKERGRPMDDSSSLLVGIFWIMQAGAPWRTLPAEFGHWHTAYTRYQDWRRSGLWAAILATLTGSDTDEPLELSL